MPHAVGRIVAWLIVKNEFDEHLKATVTNTYHPLASTGDATATMIIVLAGVAILALAGLVVARRRQME